MQLKITGDFINKTAEKYGDNYIGGYAYNQTLGLMKTYVLLANDGEIIVVVLGMSGEAKTDMRYNYNQLESFTFKGGMLSNKVIFKPAGGNKIELTIPKNTAGISDYQGRLSALLKNKSK